MEIDSVVASTTAPQAPGRPACFRVRVPRLPGYFTGAGDLFAALLLAWTHRRPGDLAAAVELAVAGLQAVLQATAAAGGGAGGRGAAAFAARELRLVECGDALAVPVVSLRAEALD
jgi:pyridoxine kinase